MTEKNEYGWDDGMTMPLLAKLKSDLKLSMLNRDEAVKSAIRVIMSEFPKITVPLTLQSGKKSSRPKRADEITDDEIISVISGLVKSEKVTLDLKKESTSAYLEVLETYLPKPATKEEIAAWIKENLDLSRFKAPLQAMGPIMKHFGKRADGNLVKQLLQELTHQ